MTTQSEQALENQMIEQLQGMGYEFVALADEQALLDNLRKQLEKFNGLVLSDKEFGQVMNYLTRGSSIFEKAKLLRDRAQISRDNGDTAYVSFFNSEQWCKNEYQVAQQITMKGKYENRYDVTLLMNGLPLVQVELKRRGLELKEAFNQTLRYQRHTYGASQGLFQYIQLFVISNGVNTKYYANNRVAVQDFKQTFFWADKHNKNITQLEEFTSVFMEPCHLSKMIARYIVLSENKLLMVLRPYQYFATEAIVDRVKKGNKNGYIWHTTGSGKTLTSFKASQILCKMPEVAKVLFVVDRKDLDYQTTREFNQFAKDSVNGTTDTKALVDQLTGTSKLIVTTLQKLNNAIQKAHWKKQIEGLKDQKVVFIFDECHRSQFGETHKKIVDFFPNNQMFGFTGTPIFADNATANEQGKRTTKDLFEDCLHKYVITDAIKDDNVLRFAIEYVGRYRRTASASEIDIEVEDIDTKELLTSEKRMGKIVDYIIANHNKKTHHREFTAMFCVSSIPTLIQYYKLFKERDHKLKIATIFSYGANEQDGDEASEFLNPSLSKNSYAQVAERPAEYKSLHSRDALEECIQDYNKTFGTRFTCTDNQSYYNYYNDISKKVKTKQIDILLVVNMFLTGFDSKTLNTLYVDKNLKHHGLIQAFSRTNRILSEKKSQGNIVCFRNLKKATDEAVALFSNKDANEVIFLAPYEQYVKKFQETLLKLFAVSPDVDTELPNENDQLAFIKAFRELIRLKNVMKTFADFDHDQIGISEQEFADYQSKYLDLYDKTKVAGKEKVSILEEVDFELELLQTDIVNVAYIMQLLVNIHGTSKEKREAEAKRIVEMMAGEVQLRSKKELIDKFIKEQLPLIPTAEEVPEAFEKFWDQEKVSAFSAMASEEKLDPEKLDGMIQHYLYSDKKPLREEIVGALEFKPKILERKKIVERVTDKMLGLVDTFFRGMG
ncbi:type I restriction endonuclease subunit R [Persicobacter psychrovividus]|uniref:Type I restriction enzyme endonuclease subunit n=1 Tax=Persicobacter psychrovividus TaxID=387638 RepID=A0ABM7VIF1_9BACT|nr:type I restriction endonuclease [Persicobacter psychrovividus]